MASSVARSLLIEFLFSLIGFPHRDDPRRIASRCMHNDHHVSSQLSQGDQTSLTIFAAVVFEGETFTGKDDPRILEAQAVLVSI
jgi:hypothetical protein